MQGANQAYDEQENGSVVRFGKSFGKGMLVGSLEILDRFSAVFIFTPEWKIV